MDPLNKTKKILDAQANLSKFLNWGRAEKTNDKQIEGMKWERRAEQKQNKQEMPLQMRLSTPA